MEAIKKKMQALKDECETATKHAEEVETKLAAAEKKAGTAEKERSELENKLKTLEEKLTQAETRAQEVCLGGCMPEVALGPLTAVGVLQL